MASELFFVLEGGVPLTSASGDDIHLFFTNWLYPGADTDAGHPPSSMNGGQELRLTSLLITALASTNLPTTQTVRPQCRKRVTLTNGTSVGLRVHHYAGTDASVKAGVGTFLSLDPVR